MHMAPRAAAWVAWVVWTCNTGRKAGDGQKRADFEVRSFFLSWSWSRHGYERFFRFDQRLIGPG
jgi:hypothetical protein